MAKGIAHPKTCWYAIVLLPPINAASAAEDDSDDDDDATEDIGEVLRVAMTRRISPLASDRSAARTKATAGASLKRNRRAAPEGLACARLPGLPILSPCVPAPVPAAASTGDGGKSAKARICCSSTGAESPSMPLVKPKGRCNAPRRTA